MKLIRTIFFPIVPVYYAITWLRNKLYDAGVLSSKSYDFPVICVGNLSVGGTGKTPMIEYLIRLLKADFKVATLSRGYKRKTKGFVLADETATAKTMGDEPFQFYSKFKGEVEVAVNTNRQLGIETLQKTVNSDVVLLDDAFQHRKVKAGFNVLLTVYDNLYVDDYVLPTGNLREPRSGAKRTHVIVVTKCPPNIKKAEKEVIIKKLKPLPHQRVFFSHIDYSESILNQAETLPLKQLRNKPFTLVTGIAKPEPLVKFLKENDLQFEHLQFKDHHDFSESDIEKLSAKSFLLTTEKDYVRLKNVEALQDKLYYLPIQVRLDNPEKFSKKILNFMTL